MVRVFVLIVALQNWPSQFHHSEVGKTWYFWVYLGMLELAGKLAKC